MEKDAKIKELRDNFSEANFMVWFLKQDDEQLKVNQLLLNKHKVDVSKEDVNRK